VKKIICLALLAVLFTMTACGNSREAETAQSSEVQMEILSAESDQENTKQQGVTGMKMKIQVGDTTFTATLAENSSVDALKELMADGPLTLNIMEPDAHWEN